MIWRISTNHVGLLLETLLGVGVASCLGDVAQTSHIEGHGIDAFVWD